MLLLLLFFNLLNSFTSGWSVNFTVCLPLPMRFFLFIVFTCLAVVFYFLLREVPLTFLIKPIYWCWTFRFCLSVNSLSLLQIWMIALPGRVFLVIGFFPLIHFEYHATPFWPAKFLLEKSADNLMGVPLAHWWERLGLGGEGVQDWLRSSHWWAGNPWC